MPRISTDRLLPGMVLGSDVKDLSGRMLLKSGTDIEEKHLKVLRTWGVTGVDVVNDDGIDVSESGTELSDLPPEVVTEIEKEIERRFIGVDISHPVMMALVEVVKHDLVKQYLNEVRGG